VRNANYEGVLRNPVIVIPGFLGSRLASKKNRKNAWGDFSAKDVILSEEEIKNLSFPMQYNTPLEKLNDNLYPTSVLEFATVRILGIPIELPAYHHLVDILIKGGYHPNNRPLPKNKHYPSLFLFAYDWRQDLPTTVKRLHHYIIEKRKLLQKRYEKLYGVKNYDIHFDIIGHSMGGLVTRYYLRYGNQGLPANGTMPRLTWQGATYVDRAIIVGTPNAGYLDTFLELNESKLFPTATLGTFQTYYQMFPVSEFNSVIYSDTKKPVDIFNPAIWEKMKWGILNPKQDDILKIILPSAKRRSDRYKIALDHLTKCLKRAKQFQDAMKIKAHPPKNLTKLYLIAGHAVKTTRIASVNKKTGEIKIIKYEPGDGKVLTSSALFDLRATDSSLHFFSSPIAWRGNLLLRSAHMGLLKAAPFEDNILFMLLMKETKSQKKKKLQ
jgi:hypothetical protein